LAQKHPETADELLFTRLSASVEAVHSNIPQRRSRFGLHRSRGIVLKLSTLFGLDAFAGGFVVQNMQLKIAVLVD
jgi:hypothetical protein